MAQTNLLTGSQISSFTPDSNGALLSPFDTSTGQKFELHKYLQRVTDTRGPRVVIHEFPYRDGAKIETLGRRPHRSQWDLLFNGPDWLTLLTSLVKAIDASPSGMLVHPIYGQMRVVCHGIDPSVLEVAQFTDTVTLSLVFTEDQTDLGVQEQQGVAAKKQDVDNSASDFQTASEVYRDVATVQAVAGLVNLALTFSESAFAAVVTNSPDPSLGVQLEQLGAALATAEAAIGVDSFAQRSIAQTYDAIVAGEVLFAACLDLADEVELETVGFEIYIVPGPTSIAVLAAKKYGPRAIDVLDQILRLNAQVISDPTAIPEGVTLTLPL